MRKYICYALSLIFITFTLSATNGTWTGGVPLANWSDNTKWSGATFPNNGEDATFPTGTNANVTINVPITLGTLTAAAGDEVNLTTEADFSVVNEIIFPPGTPGSSYLYFLNGTLIHNLGLPPTITGEAYKGVYVYYQTVVAGETVTLSGGTLDFYQNASLGNIPTLHLTDGAIVRLVDGEAGSLITNLILDTGSLFFIGNGSAPNFTTNISGAGRVRVSAGNDLLFTGTNSYTGGLTIEGNSTVTGTTTSIPSAGGVSSTGNLTFNQVADGTYSGVVSGIGSFTKTGAGILTLSSTNTYTGTTTVTAGTLSVTGSIGTSTLTTVNATLRGTGTVGQLINNGTVQAGFVAGDTLTLSGANNYSQIGGATFVSLITHAAASSLVIPGTAALAGTLSLIVEPGAYTTDTPFTVLTAAGGLGGSTFTTVVGTSGNWQVQYSTNAAFVSPLSSFVVLPIPLSSLSGNDRVVGNYMFADGSFVASSSDLTLVANVMLTGTEEFFRESLIRVSPLATAANSQVQFQSDLQMAVVLDKQFQQKVKDTELDTVNETESEDKKSAPCYGIPKTGLFIEPIGVFYHQSQTGGDLTNGGQVAFDSYTYGAGMGWEQVLDGQFVVEGGIGYTHSNLHWHENFGNSKWSTIYVAPFFGWFNERFFANFMVIGGFNFFKTDRRVAFGTINRNATSRYNSYDLLLRLNGGARIPFGKINWFQPEATLNYLTIFTEGYTEKGATSINLQVQRNTTYIMQPSFRGKWIQEFKTKKFCYSPILYAGWLANIMLQPQTVSARFRDAPNRIFFNIEGYSGTVNQLILGAEFFVQKFNQFEITSTFEVDMLSHFQVYTGKVKFEWMF